MIILRFSNGVESIDDQWNSKDKVLTVIGPPSTIDEPSDPSSNIDPVPSSDGELIGISRGARGAVGDGEPILFCIM